MVLYTPGGGTISGNVEDPLKKKPPIGGGPVGVQTPIPQPSIPIVGGGAQQPSNPIVDASQGRPPIAGGPVGVQTPQEPYHNPVWDHPGNRRWREARAQGMTAEQFQNQGAAAQVPNTAQLIPTPQSQAHGKGQVLNQGFGQMYPRQPYGPNEARMTAQRRYFRGSRTPQF